MFVWLSCFGGSKCLIFATLGGKMDAMSAGWTSARSAMAISTPMMIVGLAAFGERAGGGVVQACPDCRARVFDFRVGRAS
jgi:hypothetical protein